MAITKEQHKAFELAFRADPEYRKKDDALLFQIRCLIKTGGYNQRELNALYRERNNLRRGFYQGLKSNQCPSEIKDTLIKPEPATYFTSIEKETDMTLGVQISPAPSSFNFTKPAIADIKHVYGVPVSKLSLNDVTALLTLRQEEVYRLKALPHKPEVIKVQINKLKGEIKGILALANELFPVDAE